MTQQLKVGDSASRTVTIDRDRTIGFMGDAGRVYATPALVADIEYTCRDLIVANTPEGEDSVGTNVSIAHMAPTLLGMEVTITVTVAELAGPKVVLDVEAHDPLDKICQGQHERFVVNVEKTQARLKAKAAKVAAM